MREKYESLSLTVLRELAKARGMKKVSALKKAELIERMLQQDELDARETPAAGAADSEDKEETAAADTQEAPASSGRSRGQASHHHENGSRSPREDADSTSREVRKPKTAGRTGGSARPSLPGTRR